MNLSTALGAVTALVAVLFTAHSAAQTGAGATTQPIEPTVTEPTEVTQTKPNLSNTTEPRGPAMGQPSIRQADPDADPAPAVTAADEVSDGQQSTQVTPSFNRQQATNQERVEAFSATDANGDLRLQWQELQQQGVGMERAEFEELDVDNTDDLDRTEFVGVGS